MSSKQHLAEMVASLPESLSLEEAFERCHRTAPAMVRHLCALIYPRLSWQAAHLFAADAVRRHCQFLASHRLLKEVEEDTYAPLHAGSA